MPFIFLVNILNYQLWNYPKQRLQETAKHPFPHFHLLVIPISYKCHLFPALFYTTKYLRLSAGKKRSPCMPPDTSFQLIK